MEERLEFIFRRRSIRKYLDKPVEPEKLDLLLKAGMAAPSAMNTKPWEFVVVTDPEKLGLLRQVSLYSVYHVPAVIAVCGNLGLTHNPTRRLFWIQDCSAAIENILLAACALDLATVWIGVHPIFLVKNAVSKALKLPSSVIPLGLVYVGYPAMQKESRTQYDPERIHWQEFGNHVRPDEEA